MSTHSQIQAIFGDLAQTFTGEDLFDPLTDIVYFVKDAGGRYAVVNKTLVQRCGLSHKDDLLGCTPSQLMRDPLGASFEAQDRQVLQTQQSILSKLELHVYPSGDIGWCLTNKSALINREGKVTGIVGISQDLRLPNMTADEYQYIADATAYAETHIAQAPTCAELADIARMSTYQLDRRMQLVYGLTTGQWMLKTRLDYAERQLRHTDQPIGDIATEAGYRDQSAFTRQFRRATGMSPQAYRNSQRLSQTDPAEQL